MQASYLVRMWKYPALLHSFFPSSLFPSPLQFFSTSHPLSPPPSTDVSLSLLSSPPSGSERQWAAAGQLGGLRWRRPAWIRRRGGPSQRGSSAGDDDGRLGWRMRCWWRAGGGGGRSSALMETTTAGGGLGFGVFYFYLFFCRIYFRMRPV